MIPQLSAAGRRRGLAASHATRRGARGGIDPQSAARLTPEQAGVVATKIEAAGAWWASSVPLCAGLAVVEIRQRRRPYPLAAVIRTQADAARWLADQGARP